MWRNASARELKKTSISLFKLWFTHLVLTVALMLDVSPNTFHHLTRIVLPWMISLKQMVVGLWEQAAPTHTFSPRLKDQETRSSHNIFPTTALAACYPYNHYMIQCWFQVALQMGSQKHQGLFHWGGTDGIVDNEDLTTTLSTIGKNRQTLFWNGNQILVITWTFLQHPPSPFARRSFSYNPFTQAFHTQLYLHFVLKPCHACCSPFSGACVCAFVTCIV